MMMVVRRMLQVLVELLVRMISIGTPSKKMRVSVGLSSFLLFLVLYAKGREN